MKKKRDERKQEIIRERPSIWASEAFATKSSEKNH